MLLLTRVSVIDVRYPEGKPERSQATRHANNLGIGVSNVLHVEVDSEFITSL
jgi:hypothetical protein